MDYLSLCLICKDENDYLPEWLDYHILVGVDRFYIYDNESRVSLRECLKEYIAKGWVVVEELPGQAMQLFAYDNCLTQFGNQTRWLGFIDTDEFLVPKGTDDLRELLKDYAEFGGLAVSSLFFGSGGHKVRPEEGQLASYTLRTHPTFAHNKLIKCIVQPERVLFPFSPHDFVFKENYFCVNEQFMRVDLQKFPNYCEKIQLNHYYCRSESEIELKLSRGRGDDGDAWPRHDFETVNLHSTYRDRSVLELIERLVKNHSGAGPTNGMGGKLLEQMAEMAQTRPVSPLDAPASTDLTCRPEIANTITFSKQRTRAIRLGNHPEEIRLVLEMLQLHPSKVGLYPALAMLFLDMNDPASAWQALAHAWQRAPNSYDTLRSMVYYFIRVENFEMAEKCCHLLLGIAPHDLTALGFMTEIMIGQGRFEEALKIGVPVVELASNEKELPEGMAAYLIEKMAGYLHQKRDYAGTARLWEAGVKCQPENVGGMLEWSQALLLCGEKSRAQQVLLRAQALAPKNTEVLRRLHATFPAAGGKNKRRFQ